MKKCKPERLQKQLSPPVESGLPVGTTIEFHCNACETDGPMLVHQRWHNSVNDSEWVQLCCPRCGEKGNYPYFWPELHGRGEWETEDYEHLMSMMASSLRARNIR